MSMSLTAAAAPAARPFVAMSTWPAIERIAPALRASIRIDCPPRIVATVVAPATVAVTSPAIVLLVTDTPAEFSAPWAPTANA